MQSTWSLAKSFHTNQSRTYQKSNYENTRPSSKPPQPLVHSSGHHYWWLHRSYLPTRRTVVYGCVWTMGLSTEELSRTDILCHSSWNYTIGYAERKSSRKEGYGILTISFRSGKATITRWYFGRVVVSSATEWCGSDWQLHWQLSSSILTTACSLTLTTLHCAIWTIF